VFASFGGFSRDGNAPNGDVALFGHCRKNLSTWAGFVGQTASKVESVKWLRRWNDGWWRFDGDWHL